MPEFPSVLPEWIKYVLAHPLVKKYGFIGLAAFVAVPLPGTGAYAGTAAAWLLDMEPKRAFLAVSLGVTGMFCIVWALFELVGFGISRV